MFAGSANWGYVLRLNAHAVMGTARAEGGVHMSMTPEHDHVHEVREVQETTPVVRDPEAGSGLVGYAAIKYVAIVAIVVAILVFLAVYLIPALT
jgi:hypothetical protein